MCGVGEHGQNERRVVGRGVVGRRVVGGWAGERGFRNQHTRVASEEKVVGKVVERRQHPVRSSVAWSDAERMVHILDLNLHFF